MGHRRARQDHKRLNKLYSATKYKCRAGVWYDAQKHRFIRYSTGSGGRAAFLKKQSNKRVRRNANVGSHNAYRRHFDYKWNLD